MVVPCGPVGIFLNIPTNLGKLVGCCSFVLRRYLLKSFRDCIDPRGGHFAMTWTLYTPFHEFLLHAKPFCVMIHDGDAVVFRRPVSFEHDKIWMSAETRDRQKDLRDCFKKEEN